MDRRKSIFTNRTKPLQARMIRIIWRLLRNADDAEEVLQDVMMAVWRKLERIESHSHPDLLVLRITVDAALDKFRKRSRERELTIGLLDVVPDGIPTPREEMNQKELLNRVLENITSLPQQQSVAVFLRLIEELSFTEIAAALDCQEATARSHHSKGIAQLRERLAPFLEIERSVPK